MNAEKRYKRYDLASHLILSYYALFMVFISIFANYVDIFFPIFSINIALSATIFGTSLIVHGFRYGEVAQLHRECYLRLQRLISTENDENKILSQYHEIIAGYPNHSESDYEALIVGRSKVKGEELENSQGIIKCTNLMIARVLARFILFYIFILLMIIFPITFLLFFLGQGIEGIPII